MTTTVATPIPHYTVCRVGHSAVNAHQDLTLDVKRNGIPTKAVLLFRSRSAARHFLRTVQHVDWEVVRLDYWSMRKWLRVAQREYQATLAVVDPDGTSPQQAAAFEIPVLLSSLQREDQPQPVADAFTLVI